MEYFVKKVWEGAKEWRMGLVSRGSAAGVKVGREEGRSNKFNGEEKKKVPTRIQETE